MSHDDDEGEDQPLGSGLRRVPAAAQDIKDEVIEELVSQFEEAAHNEDGVEYWVAQEMQRLLEYASWDKFLNVIDKAKTACILSGQREDEHFSRVGKMIDLGRGAKRDVGEIRLTRYACYLIAQNGDSRKKPIAFAQTYFAIQTRRQEIQEAQESGSDQICEDEKRFLATKACMVD
jgi:DNA-damage-inducible protein D